MNNTVCPKHGPNCMYNRADCCEMENYGIWPRWFPPSAARMSLKLGEIENLQAEALAEVRTNGFVFRRSPSSEPPITAEHRWECLAFALYSRLCEARSIARGVRETLGE